MDGTMNNAYGTIQHVPQSWTSTVFDPTSMVMDGAFGLLPGVGKGIQHLGRGLFRGGRNAVGRQTNDQIARFGMKAYQAPAGAGLARQTTGRLGNYAQNMGRAVTTRTGLKGLAREGANLAKWGVPLAMVGGAAGQMQNARRQSGLRPCQTPYHRRYPDWSLALARRAVHSLYVSISHCPA